MTPQNYSERKVDIDGWPVNITIYQLGDKWHAKADNVSPGASIARVEADTREDAESKVMARAKELLSRTKRHSV
jgi:hypothetical protein